jgi:hypothetical protein
MAKFDGTSKTKRPDAVSLDYLTSHMMGPVALQDPSEGVFAYAWRARLVGEDVLVSREEDEGWGNETVLLSIVDGLGAVRALDLGFTQSGDPVLAFERSTGPAGSSEIWIYFYDPTVPGFILADFGEGRNPRVTIDQPHGTATSDVQVFYISDITGLVHRQQRDRYEIEYFIRVADEDTFLEEALIREDRRLELVIAVRDQEAGQYTLTSIATVLPPITTSSAHRVR